MKRLFLLILAVVLLSSCTPGMPQTDSSKTIHIIASLFPQYDFARVIGGDYVEVSLLLPPGVESHAYEPTPKAILSIEQADLFLFTGEFMEPWVHEMLPSSLPSDKIIDLSKGITLLTGEDEDAGHGAVDPHIWLDPQNAMIMAKTIAEALSKADPEHQSYYEKNLSEYLAKLQELDRSFEQAVSAARTKEVFFAGHQVFGYLAACYGIDFVTPYTNFSPDAEPSARSIADMVSKMSSHSTKVIYYEELIEPKVAEVIRQETGAELCLLHGAHNLSADELKQGLSYLEIMQNNLKSLQKGMQ